MFLLRILVFRRWRGSSVRGGGQRTPRQALFSPYDCHGFVLPSDLDLMLHMNNSKYLREMDFGRFGLALEKGFRDPLRQSGGYITLGAASIRYRRSLQLFDRFLLRTRIVCWSDDALYFEQRIVRRDGFVCAVMLAKMAVRGVTVPQLVRLVVGETVKSPPFPSEVTKWCESNEASSQRLRDPEGARRKEEGAE